MKQDMMLILLDLTGLDILTVVDNHTIQIMVKKILKNLVAEEAVRRLNKKLHVYEFRKILQIIVEVMTHNLMNTLVIEVKVIPLDVEFKI
jgi:hypothetical protein